MWYAKDRMNMRFGPKRSMSQALKLFKPMKNNSVSRDNHTTFLIYSSDAVGGTPDLVA